MFNFPLIIQVPDPDEVFKKEEEDRRIKVAKWFAEQRDDAYAGVPDWVFQAQLKFALKSKSRQLEYILTTPSTFYNSIPLRHMDMGDIAVDDQGFEGYVTMKNGKKHFYRLIEDTIHE